MSSFIVCFVLSESMGDFFRDLDLKPLWLISIEIMDTLFLLLQPAKSQGRNLIGLTESCDHFWTNHGSPGIGGL